MEFDTYAGRAVLTAVDLVNSDEADAQGLAGVLARHGWVIDDGLGDKQVARFAALRRKLREVFETGATRDIVGKLNAILADQRALPQLTDHDGGWHWHYLPHGSAPADRVATSCAAALLGVIVRDGDAARLRTCTAEGCRNVFVDATRNGKRRFCDNRTCGNRTHAAAYRARQGQA